jgi:hypothetical protein
MIVLRHIKKAIYYFLVKLAKENKKSFGKGLLTAVS